MSTQRSSTSLLPAGVGVFGLCGAVIVIVGGFLPWMSSGGKSVSAWGIPLLTVITAKPAQGVPVGVMLLLTVLVLLPYATRRRLPMAVRLLLAAVVIDAAGAIFVLVVRSGPPFSVGIGVLLTLAGGVLLTLGDAGIRRGSGGAG